jgi:hypothetical protein
MKENNIIDGSPAFYKMGFVDDVEGLELKEMKKKYMDKVRSEWARREIGGSKKIHTPRTENNPPTPFL